MKVNLGSFFRALIAVSGMMVTLIIGSCDKEDPNAALSKTFTLLQKQEWKIQSVKADAVDRTDVYSGMTLEFNAPNGRTINFSALAGDPIWPSFGKIEFSNDNSFSIQVQPSVQNADGFWVNGKLVSVDESVLVVDIDWQQQSLGSGRRNSTIGHHVFTFTH